MHSKAHLERHREPPSGGVAIHKKQETKWIATSLTLLAMTTEGTPFIDIPSLCKKVVRGEKK
jgi:hypothetical protein